ncbi:MAG: GNAT family N-acetyltransferase [Alphaproteobacteria bacterium]
MPDCNDYTLISLQELVYDEALFADYRAFIREIEDIYALQERIMTSNDAYPDDFVFEVEVMNAEVMYWRSVESSQEQLQDFFDWMKSMHGFGSHYESDTDETYKFYACAMIDKSSGTVVGRCNLHTELDKGQWTGMGFDCIRPSYRGQGLGHVIMAHRLDLARQVEVDKVKLNVSEENIASLKRVERLEDAGLMFDFNVSARGRYIAWIKPTLNLEDVYAILTECPSEKTQEASSNTADSITASAELGL